MPPLAAAATPPTAPQMQAILLCPTKHTAAVSFSAGGLYYTDVYYIIKINKCICSIPAQLYNLYLFRIYRSGTGKSTFLQSIIRGLTKKCHLYLVNVKSDEILKYSKLHRNIRAYARITSLKHVQRNSVLIFEDIVSLLAKEEVCLRQFLNYHAHHRQLKIFCVSHTIHKTKMFATIPLFNYIVFTSCVANATVMRNVFQSFKINKEEHVEPWISIFVKHARAHRFKDYFFFDCSKMIFFKAHTSGQMNEASKIVYTSVIGDVNEFSNAGTSPGGNLEDDKETQIKKQFENIFKFHVGRHQASALFSIIIRVLPLNCVADADLTLTFKSRKNKKKSISLVDYVHTLLTKDGAPVDSDLLVLHEYIRRRCKIPSMFQVNTKFRGTSTCPTDFRPLKKGASKSWGTGTRKRQIQQTSKPSGTHVYIYLFLI